VREFLFIIPHTANQPECARSLHPSKHRRRADCRIEPFAQPFPVLENSRQERLAANPVEQRIQRQALQDQLV